MDLHALYVLAMCICLPLAERPMANHEFGWKCSIHKIFELTMASRRSDQSIYSVQNLFCCHDPQSIGTDKGTYAPGPSDYWLINSVQFEACVSVGFTAIHWQGRIHRPSPGMGRPKISECMRHFGLIKQNQGCAQVNPRIMVSLFLISPLAIPQLYVELSNTINLHL